MMRGRRSLTVLSCVFRLIGEALKNIDKHEKGFLEKAAPKSYWSSIIRLRDLISHHYIDIDAETIYMICDEKLDLLNEKIEMLIESAGKEDISAQMR
jgi:uncharacterized protein with HEPN domain